MDVQPWWKGSYVLRAGNVGHGNTPRAIESVYDGVETATRTSGIPPFRAVDRSRSVAQCAPHGQSRGGYVRRIWSGLDGSSHKAGHVGLRSSGRALFSSPRRRLLCATPGRPVVQLLQQLALSTAAIVRVPLRLCGIIPGDHARSPSTGSAAPRTPLLTNAGIREERLRRSYGQAPVGPGVHQQGYRHESR